MPTPVEEKRWVTVLYYPAAIFFGGFGAVLWIFFHLMALDIACNCTPFGYTGWAPTSRVFGSILAGGALLGADWFVWVRWRSYRQEKKWTEEYRRQNPPWHERPEFKNKQMNDRPGRPTDDGR
ncbi:MAG: hypothetical protein O3B95_10805 [Chloroflexi bacterium]|nr:hypothetical protein [Chloroflexota bacterium]